MAVETWEQADAIVRSIGLSNNLDAAEEYATVLRDAVRFLREHERPADAECPQCHMSGRHKLSCTEPGAPRKGRTQR